MAWWLGFWACAAVARFSPRQGTERLQAVGSESTLG